MEPAKVETPDETPHIDPVALAPGTSLLNGQYTIVRYLSSGGFGITYLARDSLDRTVVIKECFPESICNRSDGKVRTRTGSQTNEFHSLVEMFVREARNVAKLRHPNIVGVHQVFEDNDTAYMALDLIDGEDLLEKLEEKSASFTPDLTKRLLRTLLDAIAVIHDQDMLHRDIAPDNILMDRSGSPVLIDFGAAREEASKKSRAISALLVVKDGYSPQEFYISGGKQGPFSDLYSLAATFYHLITGEAPINSQNRIAALAANRPDPYVPLAGRFDAYEPCFLAAIDKAINVFPDDRIQSAAEWIAMIDPEARRNSEQRKVEDDAEVHKIISQLVVEVAESISVDSEIEESKKQEQAVAIAEKAQMKATRNRLTLMEMVDNDSAPVTQPAPVSTVDDIEDHAPSPDWRRRLRTQRRIAVSLVICAVAINIFQNPENNIATYAGPEIHAWIDRGITLAREHVPWTPASL